MRRFFFSAALAGVAALMPAWAFGSDQETAQQIADALRSSGRLKDYSIGVKFESGRAFLLGRVASEQQARTAVEMAQQLPDVESVENRLEIKASVQVDAAVRPTAHAAGTSMNRDDLLFGGTDQPTPPKMAAVEARPLAAVQRPTPASRPVSHTAMHGSAMRTGSPIPTGVPASSVAQRVAYDQPCVPCHAWPSYAAYPNYAGVTYPTQYSAAAWPYIGPFYPYPQVPLGWRKVTMEWKDGWWWLDFHDHSRTFRR